MRKILALLATAALIVALGGVALATSAAPAPDADRPATGIAPDLQASLDALAPDQTITVIVTLREQQNLSRLPDAGRVAGQAGVVTALQAGAADSQRAIRSWLAARRAEGSVGRIVPFWVFNGLSVTATPDVIRRLAARADVASITADAIPVVPLAGPATAGGGGRGATSVSPEPNLALVNAPALWDLGYAGQGVVVASMDSGVDVNHPDLAGRWRGGGNSWYDPYGQHPTTPTDLTGHGTWTAGIMVGGDAGGTSIGMAPGASWIAVKIFNDAGAATATAIHQGFQWLLDPDGNPATADGPRVVNNSWAYGGPGCNLDFQLDLQALRAAGITPVFAAGNFGPGANSSVSPANNPEALAIGATNNADQLYIYSSRGPSACGEAAAIYPELVAPGVDVRTTDLYGTYFSVSGTSLSSPAASGALALLLSAFPDLTVAQQEAALTSGAVDLGSAGPDNHFGYGRLDALAAYQWLAAGGATPTATPAPPPTATAPPPPTATATPLPTPTPLPSPTPAGGGALHSGDLDDVSAPGAKNLWDAGAMIRVHDANHGPVAGATVSGAWSNGASGAASCVTDASGRCTVTLTGLPAKTKKVTFTVTAIAHATLTYQPAANHDPDGDSDGTRITLSKP